ncbi:DUF3159 domain-containing protein [Nocardioides sp.]|uniref:DUF3159 domain-containing protein n=1 Tax=Nocardioides sp. TaxID=35761 RepID=UPI00352722E1
MTQEPPSEDASHPLDVDTVEALVRRQLAEALGGRRGMLEAAGPTLLFTAVWLTTKDLRLALTTSAALAVGLLLMRLAQRGTTQYVFNAVFGIGLGWLFVYLAGRSGGTADEQALAFFLPGLIWSGAYSIAIAASCVTRWPLIGFMLGNVTGDPLGWHHDPQVVRLCTRLTWVLGMPGIVGVLLQGPVWLAGWSGAVSADAAVLMLSALRYGLGWPLRLSALAMMGWLLGRNHTPLQPAPEAPAAEE